MDAGAKLADAREVLRQTREHTDRICVLLSGGKDSLATLALCCEAFGPDNVSAAHWYLVKGLVCIESVLHAALSRVGIPRERLHQIPGAGLHTALRDGRYCHPVEALHGLRTPRTTDVEDLARRVSGCDWLAGGHRKQDSLQRRGMISSRGKVDVAGRRAWPLAEWSASDVSSFNRLRKLPAPPYFGETRVTGASLTADALGAIRDRYPDDFRRILEVFPYAEARLFGEGARPAHAVSARRRRATQPQDDPGRGVQPADDLGGGAP